MFLAETREFETIKMIKYLPVSEERLLQIQQDIEADQSFQVFKAMIQKGWLGLKNNLPSVISPYFNTRDEISIQNCLNFRRERVMVPRGF